VLTDIETAGWRGLLRRLYQELSRGQGSWEMKEGKK
jgi:hypothetical protein